MTNERGRTEVDLYLHTETNAAWGVSADGDEEQLFWLPKSQAEKGERTSRREPTWSFDMPVWLAEKEDLL